MAARQQDNEAVQKAWSELVRLAEGKPEDKMKAAQILVARSRDFPSQEVAKLAERLCSGTEPELVRLELAKGLGENIQVYLHESLSCLFNDPSEVVREQARLSRQSTLRRQAQVKVEVHEVRPKRWRVILRCGWMLAKGQRLAIAAAVISFMVFVLTVYGTYRLGLTFSNEFMETLAQINATVFALAFTIPLAASQFARYQTRPESFFDKTNLLYFLAYAVAIFFPILAGTNATSHFVAVGLSAMCLSLLIPFLFRTARKLTPKQIIGEEYGKVIRAWKDEESFAEYGSSIENIARAALKMKDYTTFNTAVESMISLVRVSMNLPAQISYGPQQPGAAGLQQAVVRIGEDSLDDRFALKIWCAWLLGLATRKHFKIENGASILKYVEYLVLSETLLLSSRKPESQHFLAKCLIEWAIFNQYPNDADADKEISRCAASLITLPQESVDEAIQDSQKRMEQSPLLGPVGPLPFGDIPNLRMHLDEMLSRLTVRTSEFFVSRKIGKLTALPADTRTLVAGPDDVSDITMLQRVCYLLEAKARKDWSTPELTEMPQDLKNEMTQSIVLKAALGGVTIGSVRGRMERKSCYISRLFVHPAFRRHGIGTRLLTEIETHFPAANALVTYLGTGEAQKIAFIRNRGYAVSEQHTLTNGLTYVYMKRTGAGIIG